MTYSKLWVVMKRIEYVKDEILKCQKNLKEVKFLGGHSCYAAGFEEGLMTALTDELEFLEEYWNDS